MPQQPESGSAGASYTYQVLDRWYMCWCDEAGVWQGPYRISAAMRRTWVYIVELPEVASDAA